MKISKRVVFASFAVISGLISATFVSGKVANAQRFVSCYPTPFYELYEHSDGGGAILSVRCSPGEAKASLPCIKTHPVSQRCHPSWKDRASSIRTNGGRVSSSNSV